MIDKFLTFMLVACLTAMALIMLGVACVSVDYALGSYVTKSGVVHSKAYRPYGRKSPEKWTLIVQTDDREVYPVDADPKRWVETAEGSRVSFRVRIGKWDLVDHGAELIPANQE